MVLISCVGNGVRLDIKYAGNSLLSSSTKNFQLYNVLHVPYITKNLLSVWRFTHDNNVTFEIIPSSYFVKDLQSKETLL